MNNFKIDGMNILNLSDCESVLLLDLITQCLSSMDINPVTGKHELPIFKSIDLRELDLRTLRTLQDKLDICVG
ncbi:unnamed protein product [marine sediment metagenome]|uniref:Uncharacterized protein n=1 Tax=marine sediment metagenome TaxID=412755 RepID=X1T2T9_9ZZZZ